MLPRPILIHRRHAFLLWPNTVRLVLRLKQCSSLEDQKLCAGALEVNLEDLMILAVIVLQAYPKSNFGCKACRGLEAGRRADLRTA